MLFFFFEGQTGWTEIEKWLNNWETQTKRDPFSHILELDVVKRWIKIIIFKKSASLEPKLDSLSF